MAKEISKEALDFFKKEFNDNYFDRRKVRDGLTDDYSLFIKYGYLNGLELVIDTIEGNHEWRVKQQEKKLKELEGFRCSRQK